MQVILDRLSHSFDSQRRILDDINGCFEPGVVSGVLGPSGSGKSTLLSIAGGLLRPRSGMVRFADGGRNIVSARDRADRTAWVFQSNYMIPRRSAVANVALASTARGGTGSLATEMARDALARVGVSERASGLVEELSGGELQRVAIARALVSDRPVIIADEPTAQLDRENTIGIGAALRTLAAGDRVVLVATHDPLLAASCDQVFEVAQGRLVRRLS